MSTRRCEACKQFFMVVDRLPYPRCCSNCRAEEELMAKIAEQKKTIDRLKAELDMYKVWFYEEKK
jgi:hypothetical protein